MRPLSEWSPADWGQITGVFTDIDDTLTTDGAITPDALQALAALKAAGLHVIPITGRPIGWSEPFARVTRPLAWRPGRWMPSWRKTARSLFGVKIYKKLACSARQISGSRYQNYINKMKPPGG